MTEDTYYDRGYLALRSGDVDAAKKDFQKALETNKDHLQARAALEAITNDPNPTK